MPNAAIEQLYNSALLGESISKELGESTSNPAGAIRRGTVLAGVASGRIKGAQLSRADAAGLGQSVHHGSGGIFGTLFHPFEEAGRFIGHEGGLVGKELGALGESFGKLPQGLLALAKKGVRYQMTKSTPAGQQEAKTGLEKIGEQFKRAGSEIIHPTEHPLGAALNIASLLSGGSGAVVKGAGALERASAEGSNLARAAQKVSKLGSAEGRPGVNVSPGFDQKALEQLKALNPNANVRGATIPRYYRAESPFTKFAWQKPLDTLVSKTKRLPIPGSQGRNLGEIVGDYYGNRLINRTRAQAQAGLNESFANSPVKDVLESRAKMIGKDPETGAMEWEAMMLHKTAGIDTSAKLDEYINEIRKGQTPDGHIMMPQEKQMMEYRANRLYQDPKFRYLLEHPTDEMKAAAYHFRRLNVHIATIAQVDPTVSEEAGMFGRLRNLTTKTTDELRHELPAWAQLHAPFAKGLQAWQDSILGRETAEHPSSPEALASYVPSLEHGRVVDMLKKAIQSFREDRAGGSQLERQAKPDYIAGSTLYQKVAAGLHGLGMEPEQASSFSVGVPLGGRESEIIPTYVPSAGGRGMQFGVQPGGVGTKLSRLVNGKEEPLEYWQAKRPFKPRNIQASTIGITPMGFTHDAEYNSFLNGSMRLDPEMIVRNAYNVQRSIIGKKLNEPMINRLAIKDEEGASRLFKNREEMEAALGPHADNYTFVPVNVWKDFFNEDVQLQFNMADEVRSLEGESPDAVMKNLEELAEESAQRFIAGEVQKAGMSGSRFGNGVALPNSFVKTILAHRQVAESGNSVARLESRIISRWKYMQLTMMPAWLLRTSIGHGIIALVDGTLNPKYWIQAHKYAQERPVEEEALRGIEFGKKYGDSTLNPQGLPMGVKQGGMASELKDVGRGKQQVGFLPQQIGRAVHTTTNWQRVAIALRKYDVEAKQRLAELGQTFDHPGGFWNIKNIDAVLDPAWQAEVLKYPDLTERILDQVSQVSYTFGDMSPFERRLIKYGLPFWGWYKFISKFVWKMPFNYPGRTEAMHMLGNIGNEDIQGLGPIPAYLESAMWFGNHPESQKYLNAYGMNPFADVANPFNRKGAMEGLIRMGQFSPIIQSVMAGFGINPITGGSERVSPTEGYETDRYGNLIDLGSGEQVENVGNVNPIQRGIGTFLRAFPEVRIPELALTHGNPVFPESIPFISEKPIGVRPESRHGGNWLESFESEFGLQMRHLNLEQKQRQLLKNLMEARKRNVKTQRKEAQRLSEPTP